MSRRLARAALLSVLAAATPKSPAGALDALRVAGADLIDARGEVVALRGVNLGNWLLLEPWMLGLDQSEESGDGFPDQHTVLAVLEDRFGAEEADRLMEAWRAGYVTPRDFELIRSFGFNAVRLPIHHAVIEDADAPGTLDANGIRWVDRALEMGVNAGVYVVLDLHGVPGGQSVDAPTGRVGQNLLWSDPSMQERTVSLWAALAARYADHPAVAAYDVVNEPFGDFQENVSPRMEALFGRIHDAVRGVDPDTLLYAPGTLQGIGFYGDPAGRGWTNTGFTEHAYPGLFGQGAASLHTHADFLARWVPAKAAALRAMKVPYLVGEFNPVFESVGGPGLTRRMYDAFAEEGWAATLWSYKILRPEGGMHADNWSIATNAEAFDLRGLRTMPLGEIQAAFASLATMPLAIDEPLREALNSPSPPREPLLPPMETVRAGGDTVPGWETTAVGGARAGGVTLRPDGHWAVAGAGRDLFDRHDAFGFVHRPASGSDALYTTLASLTDTDTFAKAGVMLRADEAADAAHVLVHATPSGRVVLARRSAAGGLTTERTLGVPGFPVGLGLRRDGDALVVSWTDAGGAWRAEREPAPAFGGGRLGLAVLSHAEGVLAEAVFAAPADAEPEPAPLARPGASLLSNGSFEEGDADADAPAGWSRWTDKLRRETGWQPVREGSCLLGYHHWEVGANESSGAWQDTAIEPGTAVVWEVFANLDPGKPGAHPPASIELRLEGLRPDGSVLTLATRTWKATELATGEGWSRLSLPGVAATGTTRALLAVYPAEEGPRDGALKLDAATLTATP